MMKHYILLAISASLVCAGPIISPLVDYDAQDVQQAQKEVVKLKLPEPSTPIVLVPGVRTNTPKYELDAVVGRNFSDNDSLIKDANAIGIRLNRYITDDIAIQIGYDRIFDADYKFSDSKRKALRSVDCSCTCTCDEGDDNGEGTDNGNGDGNGNDTDNGDGDDGNNNGTDNGDSDGNGNNNGTDNGNGDGNGNNNGNGNGNGDGNGQGGNADNNGNNALDTLGNDNGTRQTDIDRFYINALKEVHYDNSPFIPYMFAGVGYENVNDKNLGIKSQGFFNAGGGLKYSLGEKLRLVTEAKAIKKFRTTDMDIVASVGLGVLFGHTTQSTDTQAIAPIPEIMPEQENPVIITDNIAIAPNTQALAKQTGDYYIQVAVVTQEDSLDRYISRLEHAHMNYGLKPVSIHNKEAKLVLVGPYTSAHEARVDLPSVKRVEKNAFIKKVID